MENSRNNQFVFSIMYFSQWHNKISRCPVLPHLISESTSSIKLVVKTMIIFKLPLFYLTVPPNCKSDACYFIREYHYNYSISVLVMVVNLLPSDGVYVCIHNMHNPQGPGVLDFLSDMVLETEHESSRRAGSALKCWAIPQLPPFIVVRVFYLSNRKV